MVHPFGRRGFHLVSAGSVVRCDGGFDTHGDRATAHDPRAGQRDRAVPEGPPVTADDAYIDRLVDEDALAEYLAANLEPADDLTVELHDAGHSNETVFLEWGDRELVLRRPPPGETAETAHDVLREHRVVSSLADTDVPVPTTLLACDDHDVIGADFFVMERVAGDVMREVELPRFADPANRRRVGETLVDVLAAIHRVDYETVGLGDFGRPAGYTARQVERWHRQFAWAFEVTEAVRAVPAIVEIGEWLDDARPEEHPYALVHGDYKLDNVMYAPGAPPEVASVFDWELSTLGDPRADLGYLLAFWRDPDDASPAIPELVPTFTEQEGFPTRRVLVERWEDASGLTFAHERFYRTLAVYKLAAFGEMFFRRHLEGNADDPLYPVMEERVPALADRALRIIEGDEPL